MSNYVVVTAKDLAKRTGTTVESWGLAPDDIVTVFSDGTANGETADAGGTYSIAIYNLAAGNDELTAKIAEAFSNEFEDED